jgi:rhamnogalacturonan endolyase
MGTKVLFKEDFQSYKLGDYPYEPFLGAMGEYHYRPFYWYGGQWYDPTPIAGSGGVKTWMVVEEDGAKYLEFSTAVKTGLDNLIILATGGLDWTDYKVSGRIRLFLTSSCAGLLFRYQNSLSFYALVFNNGELQLFKRNPQGVTVLAARPYPYTADEFYDFQIVCLGNKIECRVGGVKEFEVEDDTYGAGRVGIGSLAPAQFTAIEVTAEAAVYEKITRQRRRRDQEVAAERAKLPQPLLWKAINLRDFGAGRSIRFGHLTGTAETQLVIAQCQRRILRDAHARISCLTAIDLNGKVLWQIGEPNPEHAFLTADLPFQVCDIDGDGRDEVIMARDFKLMILDGATGKVKNWTPTPLMDRKDYPFDRLNVDSIRICDFSGKGRPTDILIKDRYKKLWAFNSDLKFLWTYDAPVNTGHFAYTKDVNGDGREEMFVGYDLVDADGKRIWSLPVHTDHTDEIVIGKINPDRDELIGIVSGWEGFMIADLQGNLLKKDITGHAQRISIGNYRPDLPGLEICVSTYWGNQGIIYLYDCQGDLLWSEERTNNGNVITPVNWTGDGRDLILLNGNISRGGMIDGHNRQVVVFPDDGHPDLCAEVIDLTGDCRDEIVLWDEQMMYIYTQDNELTGLVDCPEKYPHYNASNYRGEYAYRRKAGK